MYVCTFIYILCFYSFIYLLFCNLTFRNNTFYCGILQAHTQINEYSESLFVIQLQQPSAPSTFLFLFHLFSPLSLFPLECFKTNSKRLIPSLILKYVFLADENSSKTLHNTIIILSKINNNFLISTNIQAKSNFCQSSHKWLYSWFVWIWFLWDPHTASWFVSSRSVELHAPPTLFSFWRTWIICPSKSPTRWSCWLHPPGVSTRSYASCFL